VKKVTLDIRLERDKAVSHHFNSIGHNISDMKVSVLEKIHERFKHFRLLRERAWILKLNTTFPFGVNTKL